MYSLLERVSNIHFVIEIERCGREKWIDARVRVVAVGIGGFVTVFVDQTESGERFERGKGIKGSKDGRRRRHDRMIGVIQRRGQRRRFLLDDVRRVHSNGRGILHGRLEWNTVGCTLPL